MNMFKSVSIKLLVGLRWAFPKQSTLFVYCLRSSVSTYIVAVAGSSAIYFIGTTFFAATTKQYLDPKLMGLAWFSGVIVAPLLENTLLIGSCLALRGMRLSVPAITAVCGLLSAIVHGYVVGWTDIFFAGTVFGVFTFSWFYRDAATRGQRFMLLWAQHALFNMPGLLVLSYG